MNRRVEEGESHVGQWEFTEMLLTLTWPLAVIYQLCEWV